MRDPSPSNNRFASESRRVLQVLHLKQSMCHRLPADDGNVSRCRVKCRCRLATEKNMITYLTRTLSLLPVSRHYVNTYSLASKGCRHSISIPEFVFIKRTSPHPLHGQTASSGSVSSGMSIGRSIGESGYMPGDSILISYLIWCCFNQQRSTKPMRVKSPRTTSSAEARCSSVGRSEGHQLRRKLDRHRLVEKETKQCRRQPGRVATGIGSVGRSSGRGVQDW